MNRRIDKNLSKHKVLGTFFKQFLKVEKLLKDMNSGKVQKNKLLFWHEYLVCYNQMRKLKAKNPFLPTLPKCLLTKEQECAVRIQMLSLN